MTSISSVSHNTTNTYGDAGRSNAAVADSAYEDLLDNSDTNTVATADSSAGAAGSRTVDIRPSTVTMNLQAKLSILNRIDMSTVKATPIWELPDDRYEATISGMQRGLEADHLSMPEQIDLRNDPRGKSFATIVVGNEAVATIDNQGGVSSDDAVAAKLRDRLTGDVNGTNGPNLAQARADEIAKLLGGSVVKADTAITQDAFEALPSIETAPPTIDYDAMKKDPIFVQLESMKQKRAEYLTQQG